MPLDFGDIYGLRGAVICGEDDIHEVVFGGDVKSLVMPRLTFDLLRVGDELSRPVAVHIVVALVVPHMKIEG